MTDQGSGAQRREASTSRDNAPESGYIADPSGAGEQSAGTPTLGEQPGHIEQQTYTADGSLATAGMPPTDAPDAGTDSPTERKFPDPQLTPIQSGNPQAVREQARDDTHGQDPVVS